MTTTGLWAKACDTSRLSLACRFSLFFKRVAWYYLLTVLSCSNVMLQQHSPCVPRKWGHHHASLSGLLWTTKIQCIATVLTTFLFWSCQVSAHYSFVLFHCYETQDKFAGADPGIWERGGTTYCFFGPPASLETRASPKKADKRGRGGLRHFFFSGAPSTSGGGGGK